MAKKASSSKTPTLGLKIALAIVVLFILCIVATLATVVIIANQKPEVKKGQALSDYEKQVIKSLNLMTQETKIDGDPYLGDKKTAKIAIVNFGSYECLYCYRHHTSVLPKIIKSIINEDKAIYVYKERAHSSVQGFNLIKESSDTAANAAKCVYHHKNNDSYFKYQDAIFESAEENNFKPLGEKALIAIAKDKNLYSDKVDQCIKNMEQSVAISKDVQDGDPYVQGTPTFLIGNIGEEGKVTGFAITGNWEYSIFETLVNTLIKQPDLVEEFRPPWYVNQEIKSENWVSMMPQAESGGIILSPTVSYVDILLGEEKTLDINFTFGDERNALAPIFYYELKNTLFSKEKCSLNKVDIGRKLGSGSIDTAKWSSVTPEYAEEGHDMRIKIKAPNDIEEGVYGLRLTVNTETRNIDSGKADIFIRVGEGQKDFTCD